MSTSGNKTTGRQASIAIYCFLVVAISDKQQQQQQQQQQQNCYLGIAKVTLLLF